MVDHEFMLLPEYLFDFLQGLTQLGSQDSKRRQIVELIYASMILKSFRFLFFIDCMHDSAAPGVRLLPGQLGQGFLLPQGLAPLTYKHGMYTRLPTITSMNSSGEQSSRKSTSALKTRPKLPKASKQGKRHNLI